MEPAAAETPWYCVVEGGALEQGDIIIDYPVALVSGAESDDSVDLTVERRTVVVLTQTCDVPKPAQTTILLAQVVTYDQLCETTQGEVRSENFRKHAVDGTQIAFFLLNERSEDPGFKWSLASFRDVYVTPKAELVKFADSCGPRLRLNSPYKEHLAQSFAKFMMRVGLPVTTHEFKKYKPAI